MWRITMWFTREWWAYLLAPRQDDVPWITVLWCRYHGHPYGVVWYNLAPDRLEPDMTCRVCGDDLG